MRAIAVLLVLGSLVACSVVRVGESTTIDLNAADATALARLLGLTPDDARRVVENRPYAAKDDLLRRHVLTPAQYQAVENQIYVGPPGTPDWLRSVPPQPNGP
jgi:DNA uptake protein ComE-like DNA-binding protein